jgi:hypothetical protein
MGIGFRKKSLPTFESSVFLKKERHTSASSDDEIASVLQLMASHWSTHKKHPSLQRTGQNGTCSNEYTAVRFRVVWSEFVHRCTLIFITADFVDSSSPVGFMVITNADNDDEKEQY